MDNVFCNLPPFPPMGGKGWLSGAFRGRVQMVLRRKGFPPAGCAAMIARVQVQQCERNRNIKARLPFAVSLLAECQRRRMTTGFLLHEYFKQSKSPFGCGHNRGSFGGGGREISPARRTLGGECQSVGQLLRSGERPAGPLLQAAQASLDRELCEWSAYHLNAKMVGDGRESLWQRDQSKGAGWCATMADAIGDGLQALALWRAGLCLVRDDSGADGVTLGEPGGVCAAWVKSVAMDGGAVKVPTNWPAWRRGWRGGRSVIPWRGMRSARHQRKRAWRGIG